VLGRRELSVDGEVRRSSPRYVDQDLSDGVILDRAVGIGGSFQGEVVQWQPRVDARADRVDDACTVLVRDARVACALASKVPLRDFQSVGLTPETMTPMRTSPTCGTGISWSLRRSTDASPAYMWTIAFMRASEAAS
jgi:hypothetical protein